MGQKRMAHGLQIRLSDPAQYQSIVDAEWNIIYDKLQKCADSGAKVVLSRLAIGDLGTQFFADRDVFCAGRVSHLPRHRTWSLEQGNPASSGAFPQCATVPGQAREWQMLQRGTSSSTLDTPPR